MIDLTNPFAMLFALTIAHFVCDYPLQGDFLARAKNPMAPLPGVPWGWAMVAHASIHAGAVWLLTGYVALGLVEFGMHFVIDVSKCVGNLTFGQDQTLHLLCKVGMVVALTVVVS